MTESKYILGLDGVAEHKIFFSEVLAFFAPYDVVLTIWGKLPSEVQKDLAAFCAPCTWIRRHIFHQSDWHLTLQSLHALTQNLCNDDFLGNLTWGLIKSDIPLGLCRSWDDITFDGSELIEEATLFAWLDHLKSKGLLRSYEKITD